MAKSFALPLAHAAAPPPPRSVRVSLTDRCDLACLYCRPSRRDGYLESRLEESSWRVMLEGLAAAGVRRVRFTGGEPLLHPGLERLVEHAAKLGFDDIALTTNATQLARRAALLHAAGLRRITISIDSLDPARFFRITRGGRLADVLAGIDAALDQGFDEVKINCVVLRGENDDELESITRWAWSKGIVPRFLEVMPVGEGAHLVPDKLMTVVEMQARLAHLLEPGDAVAESDRGPARYLVARRDAQPFAGRPRVGFISGTSDTFCDGCDRLRVTSDGGVRPCLATNDGVAARDVAEANDVAAVAGVIAQAWEKKPDGRTWKGCTEDTAREVSMRATGG